MIIESICMMVSPSNPHEVENATWMLTLGVAPVYIAFLRFMGDEKEAKKFSYSLEVGAHRRKLTWEGIPRSIRDGHRKVRDSQDGLIIPRNMALYFQAVIEKSSSCESRDGFGKKNS